MSSDDLPPPDAGAASSAFTRAQATAAGQALAASIEEAAKTYGPVSPGATFAADCVTPSGDSADADGDSIPASATLTFDCSARRLGYTGTLTGTEAVSDDQPNAVAWAFTASADLHASLTGPFGGTMVTDTGGSIVASQQSALGPFDVASTLDVDTVITNVRGIETDVTENLDATVSYSPDVEWTPGGLAVTGALDASGAWTVSVGDTSAETTLSTPEALVFSPSCDTRLSAGVVEASFAIGAQAASIRVTWSACGRHAIEYDLGAVPPSGARGTM